MRALGEGEVHGGQLQGYALFVRHSEGDDSAVHQQPELLHLDVQHRQVEPDLAFCVFNRLQQ